MIRHVFAACLALLLLPQDLAAQARERLGHGRLITNDFLGDGKDRWRTGSFASSRIWGYGWDGALPQTPGDILELRLGGQIIAPQSLRQRAPGDRPYAGVLSAGLHTHFLRAGNDFALGADLVFVGPQTRVDALQTAFHDLINLPQPSDQVRAEQVGDATTLDLVAEAGRDIALAPITILRPFVELRAGSETLARIGADLTYGDLGGGLRVRDTVSGHRYNAVPTEQEGFAFMIGADMAAVSESTFLPTSAGVTMRDTRNRYRGGVYWQSGWGRVFYGLTYLSKEFEEQDEGQVVGSVRLDFRF